MTTPSNTGPLHVGRRGFVRAAATMAALGTVNTVLHAASRRAFAPALGPRARVLVVNDLSGDIDGLFSTVHALLSPSIEICGIIGTRTGAAGETAQASAAIATEILRLLHLGDKVPVHAGAEAPLADLTAPLASPGVAAIIAEAMRTDTTLPLYVTVGGGLTEVASALLLEPRIASRFTLVWIGGRPYPAGGAGETNFGIDRVAARFVFNDSSVALWQIPSDVYARCQVSNTELQAYVAPSGRIGAWLYAKLLEPAASLGRKYGINTGETWNLGDSPLVLLTALTHWGPSAFGRPFRYEKTSSGFDEPFAPLLNDDGGYEARTTGRRIRVFRDLDTRLMLGDLFAKLRMHALR